jgi:hypothetical protein
MVDRTADQIRLEIAGERQRLVDDVAELKRDARTTVPVALAALVLLAVLTRGSGLTRAGKLLWKLR